MWVRILVLLLLTDLSLILSQDLPFGRYTPHNCCVLTPAAFRNFRRLECPCGIRRGWWRGGIWRRLGNITLSPRSLSLFYSINTSKRTQEIVQLLQDRKVVPKSLRAREKCQLIFLRHRHAPFGMIGMMIGKWSCKVYDVVTIFVRLELSRQSFGKNRPVNEQTLNDYRQTKMVMEEYILDSNS